jgi:hypothetical protein
MKMDQSQITSCILQLSKDVAAIKQKLDTDYSRLASMDASVKDHEVRISRMETEWKTSLRNASGVIQTLLAIAALATSIVALVYKL